LILFVGLLMLTMQIHAQFKILGKISDSETGDPLEKANIVLIGTNQHAVSLTDGSFAIDNVAGGNYTLEVSFVGFKKLSDDITVNKDLQLNISLVPMAILTDEVIVRATRTMDNMPFTYSMVKKEQLEKQNFGQDIPFLLNQLPSVVATSDAGAGIGYTGIRIRGSDPTRINVTINGIPLNDPESQGVYWVDVPDLASSIENIQVQRGVGTSTNGPGAFGASINIQTTTYKEEPYAVVSNSIGSYNTRRHTLNVGTGLLYDRFTVDGRLSKIYSEGYIDRATSNLDSYFLSGSYYGKSTLLKLNIFSGKENTYQAWWGVPESRLKNDFEGMQEYIINNGLDSAEAVNLLKSGRTYNFYTYEDEVDNYEQNHYQFLLAQDITEKLTFNAAFYHIHGEGYFEQWRPEDDYADYGLPDVIIGGDTITSTDMIRRRWLDNDLFGTNFSFDYNSGSRLHLIFGGAWSGYSGKHFGELIWMRIAGDTEIYQHFYDNLGEKDDFNVFLKANYALNERTFLFGDLQYRTISYTVNGIDIDQRPLNVDDKLRFFNPKFGITHNINPETRIYTSLSVGNREPDRNDYINAPLNYVPSPETLYDFEAGFGKAKPGFIGDINIYYMRYSDQLVLTGELNDVGSALRRNVEDSYRLGIELVTSIKLGSKFGLDLNAAISSNKIKEFDEILYDYGVNWDEFNVVKRTHTNTDISFSPSVIAGGALHYYPDKNLEISLLSKFVGKQYLDNTQNESRIIPSFFVNDLRVIYKIHPNFMEEIGLSLWVNNIFNALYESNGYTYGYLGGGQEFRDNLYYPQAETNFLATLMLKF